MSDLISKSTRNEFREHLVGATLREIEMAFEGADLIADLKYQPTVTGQRRSLVEQYYRAVNWRDAQQVRKVLQVFEVLLGDLRDAVQQHPEWTAGSQRLEKLKRLLTRDGYELRETKLVRVGSASNLRHVSEAVAKLDAPELARQIARLHDATESDPELAIGTAKELVESACKTILEERGVQLNPEWDLTRLGKEARECLTLLPNDVSEAAKGAESIRKLLANLGIVVQSLGEVRNLYGTGHGKGAKRRALKPRHARLAVGAATTLAAFLLETHWERGGER